MDSRREIFSVEPLSDNARQILASRYLLSGERDWEDVCRRVSRFLASGMVLYDCYKLGDIKDFEERLFEALLARVFILNSPCLFNAGMGVEPRELLYKDPEMVSLDDYWRIYDQRNHHHNLSACFVVPVPNSIFGIYEALKDAAIISKCGGGVGYDFSSLSHEGRPLDSGVGVASGPLSFMELFNVSAQAVVQGGRRRAAQIGVLRIDHPDIEKFIECKREEGKFSFFNLSVMVTSEFMQAVESGESFPLRDPVTRETVSLVDARGLWENLVQMAWESGDPGLLFFENINRDRYREDYITATNPCGEIPMYPNLSCNLGHIDLSKLVSDSGVFDKDKYTYLIKLGVDTLNRVIDVASFPTKQIERETRRYRPIGLGVMGFAHLLFKMKVRYGSPHCLDLIQFLGSTLRDFSIWRSMELAGKEGSFPAFQEGDYAVLKYSGVLRDFIDHEHLSPEAILKQGLRNCTWNTVAPTGTCSLICDTSSGIEPVFALSHKRVYIDQGVEKSIQVFDPVYRKWLDEHHKSEKPDYFVDAFEVTPEEHVLVQASWQQYISNGVSKTINLPADATVEDVDRIFRLAYQYGCKGVTVFRDQCRSKQVLYRDGSGRSEENSHRPDQRGAEDPGSRLFGNGGTSPDGGSGVIPQARPRTTRGFTTEFGVACGTLYITMNLGENMKPLETFLNTGKGGVCRANVEAISRLTSLLLRSGVSHQHIVRQLKGIRCPVCLAQGKEVTSCSDALARVLSSYQEYLQGFFSEVVPSQSQEQSGSEKAVCPDCGAPLQYQEGCVSCVECGYSKCL